MAEAVFGLLTDALLGKAVSLAADEISLSLGINKELKKLSDKLELIQALLSDAHSKQLASKVVEVWLKKLESVAVDAQIVLDDYGYEVLRQKIQCRKRDKVLDFFSPSNPVLFRSKIGHKIRDVLSSLDEVYAESHQIGLQPIGLISSLPDLISKTNRLTDPFVEESEMVGRDDDVSEVISLLIASDYGKELPVITILGMGGQGKTTLAQVVYKNKKVESFFQKKVWVCVSDDFEVGRILAQMLESLTQTTCQLSNREGLVNKLKEHLSGKTYLLVLDDAWNENRDEWDVLRRCLQEIGGSRGSKVMATTRSDEVASAMRTCRYHRLQTLSEDQSLALFENSAFSEGGAIKTPALVAIAKRVLKRCGGVPLAIKAVGGLLHSKYSESEWSMIERSELWSTAGGGVISAIKLSYDHLPSPLLKRCFAYCAIFPKDSEMEKDKLVQHWMAQGFLDPPKGSQLQMEDIGDIYFNALLKSSLFQDAKRNWDDELTCKMHDLVHDFALQLSETCSINMEEREIGSSKIDVFHLHVINSNLKRLQKSFKSPVSSKLRTLHLVGWFKVDDWFDNFRYLTNLTICNWNLKKLPEAIGKITHLRLLDICRTNVDTLPKSVVELYYLETLRCSRLVGLPLGFENLINLRHLYSSDSMGEYLIPGLSQLTNIQTVPFFKVDKSKGCQIEELEHLDNLRGILRVFGLENVSGYESASRSKLSNKWRIDTLSLRWGRREHDCDDTEVVEGLKPHSDIKSLEIDGYQSLNFPSWIILLRHLVKLTLQDLHKCNRLPSLGDLPCLEYLEIMSLLNVKCIGKEFYGWSDPDWVRKSSSSNVAEITVFPALKFLRIEHMDSLEEWSDAFDPTHLSTKAFPSLEKIWFFELLNLRVFPNLGSLPCLKELHMRDCPNLALPSCWSSPVYTDTNPDIHYLPSLRDLRIYNSDKFLAPFFSLNILAPLKCLRVAGNPSLWPKDMHNLSNLESLMLRRGSSSADVASIPWPYSIPIAPHSQEAIQYFVSLTHLRLFGWPCVTSLPDQIQHITTLRILHICDFYALEALPEWLGKLECLEDLIIDACPNLKQFPSLEVFQRLTDLQYLRVTGCCSLLKERCAKESGSEWHKIAHIPNITVNSTPNS